MTDFREALMDSQRPHILESIVRAVAERGAPPSYDEETCWYCRDAVASSPSDRHDVSCVWRRAREWAAADGGDDGGP